jgi:hypothetical protein
LLKQNHASFCDRGFRASTHDPSGKKFGQRWCIADFISSQSITLGVDGNSIPAVARQLKTVGLSDTLRMSASRGGRLFGGVPGVSPPVRPLQRFCGSHEAFSRAGRKSVEKVHYLQDRARPNLLALRRKSGEMKAAEVSGPFSKWATRLSR